MIECQPFSDRKAHEKTYGFIKCYKLPLLLCCMLCYYVFVSLEFLLCVACCVVVERVSDTSPCQLLLSVLAAILKLHVLMGAQRAVWCETLGDLQ